MVAQNVVGFECPEAGQIQVADELSIRRKHRHLGYLVEMLCGKQGHEETGFLWPVADMNVKETGRGVMRVAFIPGV